MVISVKTDMRSVPYNTEVNTVFRHLFRGIQISGMMGQTMAGRVEKADVLQGLFGKQVLLLSGPKEFGGAIKGYALLGYVEYYSHKMLVNLQTNNTLNEAKRQFLHARWLDEELVDSVPDIVAAMWAAFHDKAIVAPTSGSFGLAAYETVAKLRGIQVEIGGKTVNLFTEKEALARAWVPSGRMNEPVMPHDKLEFIRLMADKVNCIIKIWEVRETRDHYALLDALCGNGNGNGYFCPTNPKSINEFATLLAQVLEGKLNGKDIFNEDFEFKRKTLLDRLERRDNELISLLGLMSVNVDYIDREISLTVTDPVVAGRFGLMQARLSHLNYLSSHNLLDDETFNQPSIGATLAATAWIDRALLAIRAGEVELDKDNVLDFALYAPELASHLNDNKKLKLYATPSSRNVTLPRYQLHLSGDVVTTDPNRPTENGLGTITGGEDSPEVLAKCKSGNGTLQDNYLIATPPFIAIAQAAIFLHEVLQGNNTPKIPEQAGAASLAAYIRKEYYAKNISADDIAFMFRNNGFEIDALQAVIYSQHKLYSSDPWSAFPAEFTENEELFIREIKDSFKRPFEELVVNAKQLDDTKSLTFFHTGKNGTEVATSNVMQIMIRNQDLVAISRQAGEETNRRIEPTTTTKHIVSAA